jgi:hypothetical protein
VALMRTVLDILFDVSGQSLYHDCAEGRPSSVTSVEVFPWDASDDHDSEWSAIGAVETNPNTTLDAAAGVGQSDPRLLPVTATTGFAVDRSYLVTSADGFKEWFDVAEIDSGVSVTARHPLHNTYASADTVQSTRITASVDNTWAADLTNLRDAGPNAAYRVRWVYVVGGVTYVADTYFNLVRYAGKHGVRPQDVDDIVPQWMDSLPTDHRSGQGRALIDDAYTAVKLDLHGIWSDDAMVANSEVIDELTRYKTIELGEFAKVIANPNLSDTAYRLAAQAYQSRFDSLKRITDKTPTRDVDGTASQRTAIGLSRR